MPLPTNLLQIMYGIDLLYLPYIAEFEVKVYHVHLLWDQLHTSVHVGFL